MTKIKTQYNRRSFLKVSAAAGGGMLIGFSWLTGCVTSNKKDDVIAIPNEWFEINGYIKIGDTGLVTIYSPNPEIGQNVKTSMPMIVAEELDVDWNHVIVEQGALNEDAFKNPQFAGGSLSIKRGWHPLRMAGATGRRMLMEAAAKEWNVDVEGLTVTKGIIKEIDGERSISYGEIASKAVGIEIPEEVELKDVKNFQLIGTSQKNVEGKNIVTGKPLFGIDFKREGMKLAMIEHPPAFGMKVKAFNEDEIKAMPGIYDAFIVDTAIPGPGWSDEKGFLQLVAIVGDSTWKLMKAKKALKTNWEVVGELENSEMHSKRMEEALASSELRESRKDGDPESAFKKASKVIERTYSSPFLPHNTMEPMNFFAHVTDTSAELVGPTQTPKALEDSVSKLLNLPIEAITVDMTRIGGGFGRRLYVHFGVEAAAISKKIGAPVKLIYTREDDMTQGTYRPAYLATYKAGLDENNSLIAFSIKGTGLPENPVFENRFPAGTVDNYLAEKISTKTNITTGAWRAPRSHFTAAAEQSFLDEVAELAGKDPIEFRLELFDKAENNPVGENNDYDPKRYAGVLKLVKEKCNWGVETPGIYRGVAAYYCHSSYVAEVIDIAMESNKPKVKKVWCAVDCGIVINRDAAKNMVEGGVVDGIGHAMYSQLTFNDGAPEQNNFNTYRLMRHSQAPEAIEVFFVENDIDPTGLGEPGLPPAIGALANALYKATGERLYHQPFVSYKSVIG
ncbi:molybdopterin cofactor-binding domain-containing protein [Aestuariibaculum sediminum]|uniref:Xanthine dehydrogenase family protein molybdopterin-binding subunit n=1 Tax=Aestuariibaculum sediminum TaxID=2770637 RepID=A0A8J6UDA8_9FLAO|nr:molybdopterin cofactor-binding domain-containing protein [Aestuariibaculum sediminum]MBD0832724.1 xanthine dehydrogenase family protein molybdopterin-binding subunit [Aestuariibaculum sediminum]